jgi:hypothetical protein
MTEIKDKIHEEEYHRECGQFRIEWNSPSHFTFSKFDGVIVREPERGDYEEGYGPRHDLDVDMSER